MNIGDTFFVGSTKYAIIGKVDKYTYRVRSKSGNEYDMDETEIKTYRGNPYPHEHAARFVSPKAKWIARMRRENDEFGKGVHVIWAIPHNIKYYTVVPQAIRFDAGRFTAAQAKTWLRKHGAWKYVIKFEPAIGGRKRRR